MMCHNWCAIMRVLYALALAAVAGQTQFNMCDINVNAGAISAGGVVDVLTNFGAWLGTSDPSQTTYPGGQRNLGTPYLAHRPGWNPGESPGPQLCYSCTFSLSNADRASLRLEFFAFDTESGWDLFSIGTAAGANSGNLFPVNSGNPMLSSLAFSASAATSSLFFNFSYDIDSAFLRHPTPRPHTLTPNP